MEQNSHSFRSTISSPENRFYALALLVGLVLRLFQLGADPLSDFEASWALQALELARGQEITMGTQPAYIAFTMPLFVLIKETNGLARLFPALAGSLLILLPLILRPMAGDSIRLRRAGIILAFGLALDPGLVSISHLAGGPMPAISFSLLALTLLFTHRLARPATPDIAAIPCVAGVLAGLALLSGPALLTGLLGMAITIVVIYLMRDTGLIDIGQANGETTADSGEGHHAMTRPVLLSAAITILLAGTLLLQQPQGLGAFINSLPAYAQGLRAASGVPILRLPAAILVYQPLALVFALIAAGRAWLPGSTDASTERILSIWALLALLPGMLYPGRETADAAWSLIPLWGLAALELSRHLPILADKHAPIVYRIPGQGQEDLLMAGLQAILVILFSVLLWYNMLRLEVLQAEPLLRLAIIVGIILMIVIITILMAAGWSTSAAVQGLIWGVVGILLIYNLAAVSNGRSLSANGRPLSAVSLQSRCIQCSDINRNHPAELWSIAPGNGQEKQLLDTLQDLSRWHTGLPAALDITVAYDSPSLQWALRNFSKSDPHRVRFISPTTATARSFTNPDGQQPAIIITSQTGSDTENQEELGLAASYRGQDFIWQTYPAWQSALPPNLLRWLGFREAPTISSHIIVWARSDLFPGSEVSSFPLLSNP